VKDEKLFDLHVRLVRRYAGGHGARISPDELTLLVEEAGLLDGLWQAVSRKLAQEERGKPNLLRQTNVPQERTNKTREQLEQERRLRLELALA